MIAIIDLGASVGFVLNKLVNPGIDNIDIGASHTIWFDATRHAAVQQLPSAAVDAQAV